MKYLSFCIVMFIALFTHAQIPNYVPSNGLEGWWPLNDSTDQVKNNDFILNNTSFTTDRFNKSVSACSLNNSYLTLPWASYLDEDNLTISFWVYGGNDSTNGMRCYFKKGNYKDAYNEDYYLGITAKNEFLSGFKGDNSCSPGVGWVRSYSNTGFDNISKWTHILFSHVNGNLLIYRNGILVHSDIINEPHGHCDPENLTFGSEWSYPKAVQYLGGIIDDIGIWNRALTQCEISQLYNSKKYSLYPGSQIVVQKCDFDSLILQGKSGYQNYKWNDGHSGVDNTVYHSGQYLLTMTDSNGCEATDTFQVSLISSIVKPMDTTICPNNLVELSTIGKSENSNCSKPLGTLSNGNMGWWPFCGDAQDYSGLDIHGTLNGSQLVSGRNGNNNEAFYFDGNSYILFNGPFLGGGQVNEFSMNVLFKPESLSGVLWRKEKFWGEVQIYVGPTGRVGMFWANSVSGNKYSHFWSDDGLVDTGQWYDVVFNFKNSTGSIYINGKLVNSSSEWVAQGGGFLSSSIIEGTCDFDENLNSNRMGKSIGVGAGPYYGTIDQFGLWNRSLTPQEIWELYTMNDPQNLSVEWSTGDTSQSITVQPSVETSYWVKTTDGIGTCYDTCTVHVSQPMANLMGDSVSCNGYSDGSAMANPSGGINPYSYKWSTGDTINQIQNLQPGMYSVVILDSIGCADTQSIQIGEPAPIIVEINEPLRTLKDLPIAITSSIAPSGSYQYTWSPNSLFGSQSNSESPSILAKSGSQIILKVVDKNGCEGSDTATLEVLQGAGVIFPNSFSPNDDGMNDFFKPHPYFDLLDLKIYNAWGQCIYQSNGGKDGWDGTFAGEKVPAGAYVYQMQVQLTGTNQIMNQSGSVTLVR